MLKARWTTWAIGGALAVWVMLLIVGDATLLRSSFTQGDAAAAPRDWPAGPGLDLADTGHTLLAFAHPQCPCTRATLHELLRIRSDAPAPMRCIVIVSGGGGEVEQWESTVNVRAARAIPGARIIMDGNGRLAQRFGARTSGQVLMYDAAGSLRFSGGVTIARAHEGDSPGRSAVLAILGGHETATTSTPVFGCPLTDNSDRLVLDGGRR